MHVLQLHAADLSSLSFPNICMYLETKRKGIIFGMQVGYSTDNQAVYLQLESLCQAVRSELDSDLQLWQQEVLPQAPHLPQISAAEYCKVFNHKLLLHSGMKQSVIVLLHEAAYNGILRHCS